MSNNLGKSSRSGTRASKRRRSIADLGAILHRSDSEELIVIEGGERKRMASLEAHYRQMFMQAIKGDLASVRMIVKLTKDYKGSAPERAPKMDVRVILDPGE
jgi:hypothetical protein